MSQILNIQQWFPLFKFEFGGDLRCSALTVGDWLIQEREAVSLSRIGVNRKQTCQTPTQCHVKQKYDLSEGANVAITAKL